MKNKSRTADLKEEVISENRFREIVQAAVKQEGSQKALAQKLGIQYTYLNMIMTAKRPLRHKNFLNYFGVEKVIAYRLNGKKLI